MHGREYWVVDEKSSAAKNKEGEIVRTQRVLAEPRPIASGDADLEGYTRTAENEISGRFPRLPNPTLVMYVYPHLGPGGAPIPGYSTTLPMYVGVEYAMPGESPSGARP
jgi:conjugative transfer region lipoprotein (TIGR03751 family)